MTSRAATVRPTTTARSAEDLNSGFSHGGPRWRPFDLARESVNALPAEPGLIRVASGHDEDREWLVLDLRRWIGQMREDLLADGKEPARHVRVGWRREPIDRLIALVSDGARPSALAPGRPAKVRQPSDAPTTWGLYRIHRTADDTWYVGITSNLRRRLHDHARSGLFDLVVDYAEVIQVRSAGGRPVVWSDLQAAEREHIDRLRQRGLSVRNITAGGNGRPPGLRIAIDNDRGAVTIIAAPRNPIEITRRGHLDLGIIWRQPDRDWDLTLREDDTICAVPGSHGSVSRPGGELPLDQLSKLYRQRHDRALADDLTEVQRLAPPEALPVLLWNAAAAVRSDGKHFVAIDQLRQIRRDDVTNRVLPHEIAAEGLVIDDSVRRPGGLNQVMRVVGDNTTGTYLKTEENIHALRAEVIASAILKAMNWVGIADRATASESGSVLIVPELGTANVSDVGSFHERFRDLVNENATTMACERPQSLKRVTLADLRLRRPIEVLELILFDAAICNTDRNRTNIRIGLDLDAPIGTPNVRLLPLDHGRAVLNSDPSHPGRANVTPPEALLGRGPYGNPNQLLRPASEVLTQELDRCVDTAEKWLAHLHRVTAEIRHDWNTHVDEFDFILSNIAGMQADLPGLLDLIALSVVS